MEDFPLAVFVFSGKRKTGKDYVTDVFKFMMPPGSAVILRLSGPLKRAYASQFGLDYTRLLGSGPYKEEHRAAMVAWGEEKRKEDPGYFCKLAIETYRARNFPVWIVSDARRRSDIGYFLEKFFRQTILVRITASDEVRARRGYVFTEGIDDADTECNLDTYTSWDYVLNNDGVVEATTLLLPLVERADSVLGWSNTDSVDAMIEAMASATEPSTSGSDDGDVPKENE